MDIKFTNNTISCLINFICYWICLIIRIIYFIIVLKCMNWEGYYWNYIKIICNCWICLKFGSTKFSWRTRSLTRINTLCLTNFAWHSLVIRIIYFVPFFNYIKLEGYYGKYIKIIRNCWICLIFCSTKFSWSTRSLRRINTLCLKNFSCHTVVIRIIYFVSFF